jgi:protein gp37
MSRCTDHGFLELYGKPDNPYPDKFDPTFHRYRLREPQGEKKPKNIFVCSMADLFGDFIPDDWIEEVFAACAAAPQHRYLFLTKSPERYLRLQDDGKLLTGGNIWYGYTYTGKKPDSIIMFFLGKSLNAFLSVEPILDDPKIDYVLLQQVGINWIILGAESGNRKSKVIPERKWIENIVGDCRAAGVPVFMKESLRGIMGGDFVQAFPWEVRV